MVMPLYDHSPFKWPTPPYVTWLLIAINFVVFALQLSTATEGSNPLVQFGAVMPAAFSTRYGVDIALPLTLVSYTFLHANPLHIVGNMLFVWVFGDDIEEALGHGRFLVFYLACGVGGGLAFVLSDPNSTIRLIGASGAVAGILAAYLLFRPCAKITVLIFIVPVRISAFWLIGGWTIWQISEVVGRVHDGVAYWTHVGGLATGALLFVLMRPPGVRLFECMPADAALAGGTVEPPR